MRPRTVLRSILLLAALPVGLSAVLWAALPAALAEEPRNAAPDSAPDSAPAAAPAAAAPRLDDNLLDPAWFGAVPEWRRTEDIDYVWVKPGFDVRGRTIKIEPWEDPVFLDKSRRDAKDMGKAAELTELMPSRLRGTLMAALDGFAKVSKMEGDLLLQGRFVDVHAGSKAAKFLIGMGAGSAGATWDIKLVDGATGELLVAIHHRAISGTYMSEIDDKIAKWLDKFGQNVRANLQAVASGKPRTK